VQVLNAGSASHVHNATVPDPRLVRCSASVRRTFSVDTKSAVSNNVNWLIWSTIVDIFGFVGAAVASPDAHLLCILCCVAPIDGRTNDAGLAVHMHRLTARDTGADIVGCDIGRRRDGDVHCRVVPS
jgi:hypothetical protein